ncbi:multidrug resistance-associated protein 1-like [Chrysoperla carnea]|uniref:multidrug resistance-associated protein 1-like n=1 Tax=Chrysoperla carnea TaxID=189513 RepID=UPI001D084DDA|nr:multidrug resistance-associated protein 1-like [Chrysoperla carnea]
MISHSINEFCESEFWDINLTWNTTNPDFTDCFQKTVLIWIPSAFLWLFSFINVYCIYKSKYHAIRLNLFNGIKFLLQTFLVSVNLCELFLILKNTKRVHRSPNETFVPILRFLTYMYALVLTYFNKTRGIRSSGVLFIFWLISTICGGVQFRSEIRRFKNHNPNFFTISYITQYIEIVLLLLLNCWADIRKDACISSPFRQGNPEEESSFLSRIFYTWFDIIAYKARKTALSFHHLWAIGEERSAGYISLKFDYFWKQAIHKSKKNKKRRTSVVPSLCKCFGLNFFFASLLKLLQDCLTFVSPQLLSALIIFAQTKNEHNHMWKGFFYSTLLLLCAILQTLLLTQYYHQIFIVGLGIRTALITAIYRKALRISNFSCKHITIGEIVNLMTVDAERFTDIMTHLNLIWSAPFQIILALYFLWDLLGVSVFAGLIILIFLVPFNVYIANRLKVLQMRQMTLKDERVKLMNEIFMGMKILKLYGWELSFENQIQLIRNREMNVLKKAVFFNAVTSFLWSCAPFAVALITFGTFLSIDNRNVLDAKTAFVSLSLFNILKFPLGMLPVMIFSVVQAKPRHNGSPLVIENGTFRWDNKKKTLENINVNIEKGTLTALVGMIGSGKSSLINAFLGEMDLVSGKVNTFGTIAYCPQQAWIQNATVRANILFGKPFIPSFYDQVIEACALTFDIESLPSHDLTEIGEKGVNLSGGQRQRINLARAVYAKADIYFLDDPLSAVDTNVGKHIFDKVIGPQGLLKNTTRLFVTHGTTYLKQCDNIIVLKRGRISEDGTYDQLLLKKGSFAEFIKHHVTIKAKIDPSTDKFSDVKQFLSKSFIINSMHNRFSMDSICTRRTESVSTFGEYDDFLDTYGEVLHPMREIRGYPLAMDKKKSVSVPFIDYYEKQRSECDNIKWCICKHYLKSIGIPLCLLTVAMNIIYQGFSLGSNFLLAKWATDDSKDRKFKYLYIFAGLGLGQAVGSVMSELSPLLGCWHATRLLHEQMLYTVMRSPISFFDVTPIGRLISRFSKDIDVSDTVLPPEITDSIYDFFAVLSTLLVISISTPFFVVVIIPIVIFYYLLQRFYVCVSRQLKRLESLSRSPIYSHFGETLAGKHVIRAFGMQNVFIKESERRIDVNQMSYYPSIIANRWLAVRLEVVGNFIIFFAAIFAVVHSDTMNAGEVGLSVSYALQVTHIFMWLVRNTSDVETNIVAVERIKDYTEQQPEELNTNFDATLPKSWPIYGKIEFKNYSLRYRSDLNLILHNLNFVINSGEKIGICGRTGAGKSSLTLALFRIFEADSGYIYIDDIDISKIGLQKLRSSISIIPQDPVIFSGSLRLNLDPFHMYSDDEIWRALELSYLRTFVESLTNTLDFEVTEEGENFSVGQKQLICLARTLLKRSKILILDEATAAVDLDTDDLIQETIRTEFADSTVLTIAHRLNTIIESDRVLVLDKGSVVEFDSPKILLKKHRSVFYNLAKDEGLV